MIQQNVINNEVYSCVKDYHAYKDLWKPFINEELITTTELYNVVDKYAVCVKKNDVIVGHLPHGRNGRFAEMIFYFLRADKYAECKVIITEKEVNLGDDEGMPVPCLLRISGTKNMLQILCKGIQINRNNAIYLFLLITQPTI